MRERPFAGPEKSKAMSAETIPNKASVAAKRGLVARTEPGQGTAPPRSHDAGLERARTIKSTKTYLQADCGLSACPVRPKRFAIMVCPRKPHSAPPQRKGREDMQPWRPEFASAKRRSGKRTRTGPPADNGATCLYQNSERPASVDRRSGRCRDRAAVLIEAISGLPHAVRLTERALSRERSIPLRRSPAALGFLGNARAFNAGQKNTPRAKWGFNQIPVRP